MIKFKGYNCTLQKSKYVENDNIALILNSRGQKVATCTLNIDEFLLEKNEVIIKDYSENEGMFKALIEAGIIEDTKKTADMDWKTHMVSHPIGKLINEYAV